MGHGPSAIGCWNLPHRCSGPPPPPRSAASAASAACDRQVLREGATSFLLDSCRIRAFGTEPCLFMMSGLRSGVGEGVGAALPRGCLVQSQSTSG